MPIPEVEFPLLCRDSCKLIKSDGSRACGVCFSQRKSTGDDGRSPIRLSGQAQVKNGATGRLAPGTELFAQLKPGEDEVKIVTKNGATAVNIYDGRVHFPEIKRRKSPK